MVLKYFICLFASATVFSATVPTLDDKCEAARQVGVNFTSYSDNVAHCLHSISVEDIQYFFDDKFPVENNVPTVNLDLTGARVLPFAPSRPSVFKFPGGAAFDYIMSNNDNTDQFFSLGTTTLEEIMHQMHMLEMWHMASKVYKEIRNINLNTEVVCPCLVNEKENGIFLKLNGISNILHKLIPSPITDGERRVPRRQAKSMNLKPYNQGDYLHIYSAEDLMLHRHVTKRDTEESEMMGESPEKDYIPGEVYRTIDGKEYQIIPELKDSRSWNFYWKSKVAGPKSKEIEYQRMFNFAMYMFCKINFNG